ncbi:hypothetical protein, partial [Pseudokineococcus marinus]
MPARRPLRNPAEVVTVGAGVVLLVAAGHSALASASGETVRVRAASADGAVPRPTPTPEAAGTAGIASLEWLDT